MRSSTLLLFDNVIAGTATAWYTPAEFNRAIGAADLFAIQAYTTGVTGTTTLTVRFEDSSEGQNWTLLSGAPEINTTISENGAYAGTLAFGTFSGGAHARFKITLSGTNPGCRLKLYFTGRTID